jgi:hypothetical protein
LISIRAGAARRAGLYGNRAFLLVLGQPAGRLSRETGPRLQARFSRNFF